MLEPSPPAGWSVRQSPLNLGRAAVGLVLGAGLLWAWGVAYREVLFEVPSRIGAPQAGWLLGAFGLMALVVALQVLRTASLFPELRLGGVVRPVLVGHATNTAFALAGDVLEAWWLARASGVGLRQVAVRMGVRAVGTVSVAMAALGNGLGGIAAALGFTVLALSLMPMFLGGALASSWGWRPPDRAWGGVYAVATLGQLVFAVGAVWCVAHAWATPMTIAGASAAAGAADLAGYLPVPLASLGLHHIGFTLAAGTSEAAMSAASHHALVLLLAVAALCLWPLLAGAAVPEQESR